MYYITYNSGINVLKVLKVADSSSITCRREVMKVFAKFTDSFMVSIIWNGFKFFISVTNLKHAEHVITKEFELRIIKICGLRKFFPRKLKS